MSILIDADGCPVVYITVSIAKEYSIECVVVCDTSHEFSIEGVKIITVDKEADSADLKIANILKKDDIVITQDYGLAAICLAKGGIPINQNGIIFSNDNIDMFLNSRYINKKAMRSGAKIKGPKKRTAEQDIKFKKALLSVITKPA